MNQDHQDLQDPLDFSYVSDLKESMLPFTIFVWINASSAFFFFFLKNYIQGSPGFPGLPGEKVGQLIKFFFASCDIILCWFMMMFLLQGQEGPSPVIPGPRGQRVIYDNWH